MEPIAVYLEVGKKRTFACAVEWPGWCRSGRDADSALRALAETAPRYAAILRAAGIPFDAPADESSLAVVEEVEGNATTDFGAPDASPPGDARPVDPAELGRLAGLLRAYWRAFDRAVEAARGHELRKGPRGGGRDLEGIVRHVMNAERGYLARLARKLPPGDDSDLAGELSRVHEATLEALAASVRGEVPERGPRGGLIWTPRNAVRRVGWHVIDHIWEIEDRVM
jgi:hypothetical protein